jgi:hypothetical protein
MNETKLSAALDDCLRGCLVSDRPFSQLRHALDAYKSDPAWTQAEVVELQTRVIRALMGHWRGQDKS